MTLPSKFTVEEYLRREEASEVKHEFRDGEIVEVQPCTFEHSLITANIAGELASQLKGTPCRVLASNMRYRLMPASWYVYPDASVVCESPQFDPQDSKRTTIINPRVIIEVLSDTTEAYARGEKFTRHPEIELFHEYVLVAQDNPLVQMFTRQSNGKWLFNVCRGIDAVARFCALKIDIPLKEVYARVTFPDHARPPV